MKYQKPFSLIELNEIHFPIDVNVLTINPEDKSCSDWLGWFIAAEWVLL